MCLIAFAIDSHPDYSLILAANRDEYRARPTDPAGYWTDTPYLLAGRDRQAGGTWLGVTTGGKLAAVTNYRDPGQQVAAAPSRGRLVTDYLGDLSMTADQLTRHLVQHADRYDGFNLLYGTISDLQYFTNRGGSSGAVQPGIHTLSNHLLDSAWPKAVTAKERLTRILEGPTFSVEDLIQAMTDPAPFEDHQLPDTGIGLERERFLSPLFISGQNYGTRSTSVILAGRDGSVTFVEQSHVPTPSRREFGFEITPLTGSI